MEHKLRIIEPETLMSQLPEMLLEAECVPLVISGNSMAPFLRHGRDTVYLSRVKEPPKKGDMVLYRRDCGAYILHRIYRVREGRYDMIGDAQLGVEPGIRPDQLLATVRAVRRKGKLLRRGHLLWDFFAHAWLFLVPVRPWVHRLYAFLKPWRKRK
jgi:hypothetical protein